MRRFFTKEPLTSHMEIRGEDAHHIGRVLRMQPGDVIAAVGPDGRTGCAKITQISADAITFELQEILSQDNEPPIKVYLAQGLAKGDKMDYIVQKAVELGVNGIYPMDTGRSVVRYDTNKGAEKCKRWQKIAVEAAKQCGRSLVPDVEPISGLSEILAGIGEDAAVLMLYEGQASCGIKQALSNSSSTSYLLLIGPEGGFNPAEVELCRAHGGQIVTMGPRIMRTETAALAALAVIMYECGDLGG